MKKTIRLLLVSFAVVLLTMGFIANAQSDKVTAIEGASIRLEGKQGLRFYAKLDESVKTNKHGFYLIYGVTTISELENALLNDEDINGKEIFKVIVPGVTNDNGFTVVLTDIPSSGYYQNITVIPFVEIDEVEVFNNAVTRSVAAVALNMANDGKDIDGIADVEGMLNTPLKKYKLNSSGYYEISSGVYETHHDNLKMNL